MMEIHIRPVKSIIPAMTFAPYVVGCLDTSPIVREYDNTTIRA